MKKFPPTLELRRAGILHIFLLAFFLVFVSGQVFAQEESSNKLTCDEVWEIVGTEDCPDWSVNTDLGGVWCDIKSLDRAPWTAGLAPKYTFAPGTCKIEKADQPQEQSNQTQTKSSKPAPSPGQSLIGWIKG
ncbi:MAG: hypothetical protein HYU48_01130, partial [Candidatus Levybacteria bacterium]|nr:hypothetical protein [Candidatus Levybacteria bacterium]